MILLAFGSNLPSRFGSPAQTIVAAGEALSVAGIKILKMSSIWKTAPVPMSDQPWYCNAVAEVETSLAPLALLSVFKALEADFGRLETARNAPRVLDLDILAYHEVTMQTKKLVLPHPRLHERGFVLYPLQEIAPAWRHPVSGEVVADMIARLPQDQVMSSFARDCAA